MNENSLEAKVYNLCDSFSTYMNNTFERFSQRVYEMEKDFDEKILKSNPSVQELQRENDDLKQRLDQIFDIQAEILKEIYDNST